jgi:drug/metabolite transporter (DMT)-like permease
MLHNKTQRAHLYVLIANICFGVNFSFVKILSATNSAGQKYMGAFALNVCRVCIATLLFWVLYFILPKKETIKKEHWGRLFLCAICGVVLNQTLFIKGLHFTSTIHAALLILVTPVFITVLSLWVNKEKLTHKKILGFVLAICGAILLTLQKENEKVGSNIFLGDVFIILNAIVYAIYFIIVKPLMQQYHPLTIIRWVFTLAIPFIVGLGYNEFTAVDFGLWQPKQYWALVGVVIGASFIAYLCNAIALQQIGATKTGSYIYLQPFIATLMAMLFLNDTVSWQKLLSGALIIFGVSFINAIKIKPLDTQKS